MANPSVVIDIAAEYTGKRAFASASKATTGLEKNVKSLARTFGLAFSTTAVLAYGKASVRAAAADIKAQKQLALTLKNVGLERDAATAEGYIQRIEKEFGVIDDKLRPAYASLSVATRNTAETQRILGIALDISASTGKDLSAVVAALSKAYLGNNTSLGKLGVGISKADLKTKSFKDITDQLAVTFAGSAKASADSFAGSMDKLAIASNNAKEIIGTSLIGALQSLGKDDSMSTLSSNIEDAAKSLANFIDSVVYLKGQIASIPGAGLVSGVFGLVGKVLGNFSPQRLTELIKAIKGFEGMGNVAMTGGSNQDFQKADAAAKKAALAKSKADKLAATSKIKADKAAAENAAKLSKAAALFDMDKIQIEAALKGNISDEESLRLRLQQAILNEDASTAEKLQKQLEASQRATAQLTGQLYGIKPLEDPFAEWIKSLKEIGETLSKILGMPVNTSSSMLNPNATTPGSSAGVGIQTPNSIVPIEPIPVVVIPDPTTPVMPTTNMPTPTAGGFGFSLPSYITSGANFAGGAYTPPVTINVITEGNIIGVDALDDVVNQAFVNAQRKGLSQTAAGSLP
jgi:hypothetical protein